MANCPGMTTGAAAFFLEFRPLEEATGSATVVSGCAVSAGWVSTGWGVDWTGAGVCLGSGWLT